MSHKSPDIESDRRPLASRQQVWAHRLSMWLANAGITPNQISFASVGFSAIGLVLLIFSVDSSQGQLVGLYLAAAFTCQLRLLCNLMDGMVAIEAGKQTEDGALWNEFPDRLADIALLLGVGIAAGEITLAWSVAALAILVAYVRELGKGIDGIADYSGPMAKPHRMALITAALVLGAIASMFPIESASWFQPKTLLALGLWICGVGCVVTVWRRISRLLQRLNA